METVSLPCHVIDRPANWEIQAHSCDVPLEELSYVSVCKLHCVCTYQHNMTFYGYLCDLLLHIAW